WSLKNTLGIFLFNIVIIVLVLLHTANYFNPYFFISINVIFFIGFILLPIMLKADYPVLFLFACLFWILSAILKFIKIDVWAERSSIYAFQAFFVGVVVLFLNEYYVSRK
ncbi:MAG: hypothetical protein WC894_05335, partial [Patescibacteria group bacterium]